MRKITMLMISILVFTGCVTQNRCLTKFPPDTIQVVETIHSVEWKDSIVERLLPGDTVWNESEIVYIDNTKVFTSVYARTELAEAKAWIENDRLRLRLVQIDSIMQFKLDSVVRISSDTVKITNTVIHEKEVDKALWKYSPFWIMAVITVLCFIAWIRSIWKRISSHSTT